MFRSLHIVVLLSCLLTHASAAQAQVTTVPSGQVRTGLWGGAGSQRHFRICVPAGTLRVTFQIGGGWGDADLYVRFGLPASTSFFTRASTGATNSETIAISSPRSGYWYFMIRGYRNYGGVWTRAITNGPSTSGTSTLYGTAGSVQFRYIDVPAGATRLTIQSSGGVGDADLYVRYGLLPTLSAFQGRSINAGNYDRIIINYPTPGRWWVMVHGYTSYSGVSLRGWPN